MREKSLLHQSETLGAHHACHSDGSISVVLRRHLASDGPEYSISGSDSSPFFSNVPLMRLSFNVNSENNGEEAETERSGLHAASSGETAGTLTTIKSKNKVGKTINNLQLVFCFCVEKGARKRRRSFHVLTGWICDNTPE